MTNIVLLIGPGRHRLTRQCLDTLAACTDPSTYTLTLVCDEILSQPAPDFRTGVVIARHRMQYPANTTVLHVENSSHTLSRLKNIGVAWSEQRWGKGDWLYVGDGDTAFTPGWLEKLTSTAEFTEPSSFQLWGGQIHPFHHPIGDPVGGHPWNGAWVDGSHESHSVVSWQEHGVLDGPSWFLRWTTWGLLRGFSRSSTSGVCMGEDGDFCDRLIARGGRIGVISPHVVIHTGLTHLNGQDAPGRKEREKMIPQGVLAE